MLLLLLLLLLLLAPGRVALGGVGAVAVVSPAAAAGSLLGASPSSPAKVAAARIGVEKARAWWMDCLTAARIFIGFLRPAAARIAVS